MGCSNHTIVPIAQVRDCSSRIKLSLILQQLSLLLEIIYHPLIAITRLSLCFQFIRIFVIGHDAKFWCIQGFIWINMIYYLSYFFVSIFQCNHIAKNCYSHCIAPGICTCQQSGKYCCLQFSLLEHCKSFFSAFFFFFFFFFFWHNQNTYSNGKLGLLWQASYAWSTALLIGLVVMQLLI